MCPLLSGKGREGESETSWERCLQEMTLVLGEIREGVWGKMFWAEEAANSNILGW
jgi:hypothetical protein